MLVCGGVGEGQVRLGGGNKTCPQCPNQEEEKRRECLGAGGVVEPGRRESIGHAYGLCFMVVGSRNQFFQKAQRRPKNNRIGQ